MTLDLNSSNKTIINKRLSTCIAFHVINAINPAVFAVSIKARAEMLITPAAAALVCDRTASEYETTELISLHSSASKAALRCVSELRLLAGAPPPPSRPAVS